MRNNGVAVANGEEHRWWIELVPWIGGLVVAAIASLWGFIVWVGKDRIAIQRMLEDHDQKLTRLIGESDEWDGGHQHDRSIRDVSAELGNLAVEMRTEVRSMKERMDSWFSWRDHGGRREN